MNGTIRYSSMKHYTAKLLVSTAVKYMPLKCSEIRKNRNTEVKYKYLKNVLKDFPSLSRGKERGKEAKEVRKERKKEKRSKLTRRRRRGGDEEGDRGRKRRSHPYFTHVVTFETPPMELGVQMCNCC